MIDGASERDVLPEAPGPARTLRVPTYVRDICGRVGTNLVITWEAYAIVLIAAFLRLWHIEVTDFDYDQANIYRMAYGALHHGWLVATANGASIPILNPPVIIYLLMLPAVLSANPVWAAVMVAVSAVAAVLLTYIFVRGYFGRLAGTFAALIFATAGRAVFYSRFSWQQNFIPLFLLLFLFALFAGVVERRKGWLFPAILLLGLLYQLHATASLLIGPLLVALCLSPGTVRWRDLIYGLLSLVVLYSPYLLWEFAVHFADVQVLLAQSKLPSHIDGSAFGYYLFYLSPYATPFTNGEPFTNTRSVLYSLYPLLFWLRPLLTVLIIAAAVVASVQVVWTPRGRRSEQETRQVSTVPGIWLYGWWRQLRATPYRCALLVLLAWQVIPLLALSRHSVPIYPHYLIVLMPGQYILIGILLAQIVGWLRGAIFWQERVHQNNEQEVQGQRRSARYGRLRSGIVFVMYALIACVMLAQFVGSAGNVLDYARGNYVDTGLSRPYYNDLHSLQNALKSADELAVGRHMRRVYIVTDFANQTALTYLAGQMRTPTTLFNGARCVVLPDPTSGPVVVLLGPRSTLGGALMTRFAHAELIGKPQRLGGPPFQLYVVNVDVRQASSNQQFQNYLSALDGHVQRLVVGGTPWLVTKWGMLHAVQQDFRVTYGYRMMASGSSGVSENSQCVFSDIHAGDQLLVAFPASHRVTPGELFVQAQYYTIKPRYLVKGGLTFESDAFFPPDWTRLETNDGKQRIGLVL
jgi:4-amino-4-deoxy-L-arabinose transferase-like glycosyltransferase